MHLQPLTALFLASLALAVSGRGAETHLLKQWRYAADSAEGLLHGAVVTIPHSWNATDIEAGKGVEPNASDGYRRSASWYETVLPPVAPGKRVFVRFDGVSSVADAYLNGKTLGEHRGPTTAFAFELTAHLQTSQPNVLRVKADNTWRDDVAPISGDFGVPGGIYRKVTLIEKDPICFSPLYLGSRGVIVTQLQADAKQARLRVLAHLDRGRSAATEVRFTLCDREGRAVAHTNRPAPAGTGAATLEAEISLPEPHLWNGVRDPYLYTLRATLVAQDGSKDEEELPIGFRTLTFDAQRGCLLNGQPYPLRGVCRHQDRENQSWAVTDEQQAEDVALIREIGANAVRCAHYAHSEAFLDACDRAGLLVWAEVSVIDTVGFHPGAFAANAESQLREMIAQQRHHPSVFAWSIFNEIGHRPGADAVPVLQRLNAVAKAQDPARPTVGATNQPNPAINAIPDLIAFNSYPGWYGGSNGSLDPAIKRYHETAPSKPWGISEYGAGASLSQQDEATTNPKPDGKWHPEAWQCRVHEQALASIQRHPELWGTFVWNMFDFASPWRHEGERDGINDKGLVTYDRRVRKDAFYLYQANWSTQPVLHLLARRFERRIDPRTVIRFYTNVDDVRVTLNGAALPRAQLYGPKAWVIHDVTLRPGMNVVEAMGTAKDGRSLNDRVAWILTTHPTAQGISSSSEQTPSR